MLVNAQLRHSRVKGSSLAIIFHQQEIVRSPSLYTKVSNPQMLVAVVVCCGIIQFLGMIQLFLNLPGSLWCERSACLLILRLHSNELTTHSLDHTVFDQLLVSLTCICTWAWQRLRDAVRLSWHPPLSRTECLNGRAPHFRIEACIHGGWLRSVVAWPWLAICPKEIIWPFAQEGCCV